MREFELLDHVYAANRRLPARVAVPPGDDMAVIDLDGPRLLVAVDQLVGGRHVRLDATPIEDVGRKAVHRCVSDVAAMAARPVASLCAATLPAGFGTDRANALFDAMRGAAEALGCPLVGGDVAIGDDGAPLVCAITVLAEPGPTAPVRRDGARVGDDVYVTGAIGGAVDEDGGGHHLAFVPRVAEGLALAEALGPRLHAMIDVSDGLGRDAEHLAHGANVAIEIDARAIPMRGDRDWRRALRDGEDYELLFTADGAVPATVAGTPVTRLGRVVAHERGAARVTVVDGAERVAVDDWGWEHGGGAGA